LISADQITGEQIILDGVYKIWDAQVYYGTEKPDIAIITGVAVSRCGGCGKPPRRFALRMKREVLEESRPVRRVLLAITDQLSEEE